MLAFNLALTATLLSLGSVLADLALKAAVEKDYKILTLYISNAIVGNKYCKPKEPCNVEFVAYGYTKDGQLEELAAAKPEKSVYFEYDVEKYVSVTFDLKGELVKTFSTEYLIADRKLKEESLKQPVSVETIAFYFKTKCGYGVDFYTDVLKKFELPLYPLKKRNYVKGGDLSRL